MRSSGLDTMLHCVPSQCSMTVPPTPGPDPYPPTAHTSLVEMAATPRNPVPCALGGLGLGTTLHCTPFQCSVSVTSPTLPTAQTSLDEITETDNNVLF